MTKIKDLTGQKFGKLTVLEFTGINKNHKATWLCQCECGNKKIIVSSSLLNGYTMSCGCLHKQMFREKQTIHGLSNTRIYKIWKGIKRRCYSFNAIKYPNYGGRGIIMCNEWKNDFMSFYNWAMANGYKDDLTIDRIDVNGNYESKNCRWATPIEQANNKTSNRYFTVNGETYTMKEWSVKLNLDYKKLRQRQNILEIIKKEIANAQ